MVGGGARREEGIAGIYPRALLTAWDKFLETYDGDEVMITDTFVDDKLLFTGTKYRPAEILVEENTVPRHWAS